MTVCHRKKSFGLRRLRPYRATKRIGGCYYRDECEIATVSGMPEGIGKSDYVNHFLAYTHGQQSYQPFQDRVAQARGTNQSSEVALGLRDHKDVHLLLREGSFVYCDMCGAPLCEECGNLGLCSTYAELW